MPGAGFSTRAALRAAQLDRLRSLLEVVQAGNAFQRARLVGCDAAVWRPASLEAFCRLAPCTTKAELAADQAAHPPFGTNLSFPPARYTRCHQTSGTTGTPLRWLDTPESWAALTAGWIEVLRAAGVAQGDRVFFAFSFGPFLGFWMAFAAAERLGCLCLSGGGMSSVARVRTLLELQATVVCCTPTYALHLAETAQREGLDLRRATVRRLLVAGEPGGSQPATRARLAQLWPGARVFDHHGMTEVGPVTYECPARPGVLHVMEHAFLAEVLDPHGPQPVGPGQRGELVLTTLLRTGSPVLRYRTGDLVQPRFDPAQTDVPPCDCGRVELALEGGILGRTDDMVIVRGVNLYPAAVDEVVRRFAEVAEYQVQVRQPAGLAEITLEVEPVPTCHDPAALAAQVQAELQTVFALRVPVTYVPPGSLPRFELKARRWVRL